MRTLLTAALALPLALAACAPRSAEAPAEPVAAPAGAEMPTCNTAALNVPLRSLGDGYTADATATGADCSAVTVVLNLRAPDGTVIYSFNGDSSYLLGFADASDIDTMQVALEVWAGDPLTGELSTTADLPEWPEGTEMPFSGEFPFYVEDGMDRAAYEQVRSAATPMYCHVQGVESMACLSIEAGGVRKIGAQALPG